MLKCIVNEDGMHEYIEVDETPTDEIITADMLKTQLAETDYKIIKCMEYTLTGLVLPYDIKCTSYRQTRFKR